MTPERYQEVGRLFHEALERAPAERAAFLKQAIGDDDELRIEVEKLLAHQVESAEFLTPMARDVAAALLAQDQPPLEVGQQLGHYQIPRAAGSGRDGRGLSRQRCTAPA
jgi:serine/threonine-protein kinase